MSLCVFLRNSVTLVDFHIMKLFLMTPTSHSLPPEMLFQHAQEEFIVLCHRLYCALLASHRASLLAQKVKNMSAMQETRVRSLGREDPMEKEMATHSSILDWRIPWTEEPEGSTFHGFTKSQTLLSD